MKYGLQDDIIRKIRAVFSATHRWNKRFCMTYAPKGITKTVRILTCPFLAVSAIPTS